MVLTVSFVLAPETGLVVSVGGNARALPRISASGYQAHTTSPFAPAAARHALRARPSHPAPNVRDDRDTPLLQEEDGAYKYTFSDFRKLKYF